jgi:hypothetical protein
VSRAGRLWTVSSRESQVLRRPRRACLGVRLRSPRSCRSGSGGEELFTTVKRTLGNRAELALYDAGHVFTAAMRERAYQFLSDHC